MPNQIDIYQPRYLAEVVRSAPPVHTFLPDWQPVCRTGAAV